MRRDMCFRILVHYLSFKFLSTEVVTCFLAGLGLRHKKDPEPIRTIMVG